jgi:hypothetical protein
MSSMSELDCRRNAALDVGAVIARGGDPCDLARSLIQV